MKHSAKKDIFIIMSIILFLCLSFYELSMLSSINQKIDQLSLVETTDQQLRSKDYYQAHLIDISMIESLLKKPTTFFLYIHNAECSACEIADEYFSLFIELGYHHETDIYFIDISSSSDVLAINNVLINKNIELNVTPTLYLIAANEISIQAEGSDDIYNVLNRIVKSVRT